MLQGMQGGFEILLFFMSLGQPRSHTPLKERDPKRENIIVGSDNVAYKTLVKKENHHPSTITHKTWTLQKLRQSET